MPACKYPVALWKDPSGSVTGVLLDVFHDIAVYADNQRNARRELKDRIRRQTNLFGSPIDYEDFEIPLPDKITPFRAHLSLRPQYTTRNRNYPLARTHRFSFQYFAGPNLEEDMGLCIVPMLGLGFEYFLDDAKRLGELACDRIAEHFKGAAPEQLSEYLAQPEIELLNLPVISKHRKGKVPWTQRSTAEVPELSATAEPLSRVNIGRSFDKALARESDVAAISEQIRSGSLILLGPSGIGKTTILCGAIVNVERGRKDAAPRFWRTSASRISAGMRYLGQWEERCEKLIGELTSIDGTLCFNDISELLQIGGNSSETSIGAYLLSFLRRGSLRLVVEATPESLAAARRRLPEFVAFFQIHTVTPLSRPDNVRIIERILTDRTTSAGIALGDGVPGLLYRYFERFEPYRAMPGEASGFAKRLIDKAARKEHGTTLERPSVTRQYKERTGLPDFLLDDTVPLEVETVYSAFVRSVKGQNAACRVMAETVLRFKAGLNDPHRPISVLLFAGPTGVGKTQLAKVFTRYLFGQTGSDRLIRLDMSEFGGPGSADRLMGTYAEEPTPLVRGIRTQPFSVVLLDEIEKAAPEVFDLFMGIFDEGRYTDPFGRLTHFQSSVIIMTSNLGVTRRGSPGFHAGGTSAEDFRKAVMDFFRPEFFNRMDAIVPFTPLSPETFKDIALKEVDDLRNRETFLLRKLQLEVSPAILDRLLERGYDPKLGARPLQRALEEVVTSPVARYLALHPKLSNATLQLDLTPEGRTRIEV